MLDDDERIILTSAAVVLKHKGYSKHSQAVMQVVLIEAMDECMLDDFDN